MTKEEILNIYLGDRKLTRENTMLFLERLLESFPEENIDVLQSVIDEYDSKIVLEQLGLYINPEATTLTADRVKLSASFLSANAAERVANQINAKIIYETQKRSVPITPDNTFLNIDFMQISYPDVPRENLMEAVEMYNSDIILESLKQNSDITANSTTISPEFLKYTFPGLTEGIVTRVCEQYNSLIYFEMLKEKVGSITAETEFVTANTLRKMYPELSEQSLCTLENDFNALVVTERENANKKPGYNLTLVTAKDFGTKYPEVSYEALIDASNKYNSNIILQQLIHNQTPTVNGTFVSLDSLSMTYPSMPKECLEGVANAYNEMILHEIMIADGIDVNAVGMKKSRIELNPSMYKKISPILKSRTIPVTLVIKNASELSCEDLEKMPSNVDRVVIRDGDNTPERGMQRLPYNRKEYLEARRTIDEKILKDIPFPKTSQDELSIFLQIFEAIANHVDEYDEYAITEKGEKDKRLEKTCRNLYGGLVQKRCVCAGFADILRNACACRGIEVKYIRGWDPKSPEKEKLPGHAWNQVCINGNWLNVDLTWAIQRIKENGGKIPEDMTVLFSDKQFSNHDKYSKYRTKSEKKCLLTLEEALDYAQGKNTLGQAIRHFAKDVKGNGIRLSEIRRVGDYFGKALRAPLTRNNIYQREQNELSN